MYYYELASNTDQYITDGNSFDSALPLEEPS